MGVCSRCLLIAFVGVALSNPAARSQTKQTKNPGPVSSLDRFSGPLAPAGKAKAQAKAKINTFAAVPIIHYQTISLAPRARANPKPSPADARLLALPLRAQGGFTLYELRAGKVTTIINGSRQERTEGEFWLVRPGDDITLEADDDSVLLQTLQIPGQ